MSKESPVDGNALSQLAYLLNVSAADLQRVLGLSPVDWGMYVNGRMEDGSSPVLSEPTIAILTRLYTAHPEACPVRPPPDVPSLVEAINKDRVSKSEVRELEQMKGIKPKRSLGYVERARQLGLRLHVTMVRFALALGKEASAGNRWIRGVVPPPAVRNLLYYMEDRLASDGDSRVFEEIEELAQAEASARGMGDLSEARGWKTIPRSELKKKLVRNRS